MEKSNTIFDFFKLQMHKVQMPKLQIPKLQMTKLRVSMMVIHRHQLLIFQFLKIILKDFGELMAINLILVPWSIILDCIIRYGNMMLITEMKFKELTLELVHTNLWPKTTQNLEKKVIFVAFNICGTIYFLHGLNIHVKRMQHFVYSAFILISHLDILHTCIHYKWIQELEES
jgi:hypothetical protein